MRKNNPETSHNKGPEKSIDDEQQSRSGIIRIFFGFLDKNFNNFSPLVQDTIGIGVLLILISIS